jgi:lysophospholipase L1-like esterase
MEIASQLFAHLKAVTIEKPRPRFPAMRNGRYRVLCFGDSNTWGYSPEGGVRYPAHVRWTGVLQELLGDEFEIIEEGLNGRTTAFDYQNRPGKNGRSYLAPCMDSHHPLDFVILCLGTNDTKKEFNLSPEEITAGLAELVQVIHGRGLERPSPDVKLILVGPPLVSDAHLGGYDEMIGSEVKTRKFRELYKALAAEHQATFVDLSSEVLPSPLDGCHLSPESHARIASIYAEVLNKLIASR